MKKVILVFAFVLGMYSANAQFTFSVNAGLPVGDVENISSFALSGDIGYSFPTESDVKFGVSAGFLNYFGKDYEVLGTTVEAESIQYAPVAGFVSFRLSDKLSAGTKLGYAIGINDGNDGGFYFKPMLGFLVGETTNLSLYYEGVSNDGNNFNNIGLGLIFAL